MPASANGTLSNGVPQPKNEQEAEKALTGLPFTAGYVPQIPVFSLYDRSGPYLIQQIVYDVEAMLLHPHIALPYSYYKSGIANVKFKVRASSPDVEQFVQKEIQRFWTQHVEQVQLSYDYGWAGYELSYRVQGGMLTLSGLSEFFPLDTQLLTSRHRYVGVEVRGVQDVNDRRRSRTSRDVYEIGNAHDAGNVRLWGPKNWPAKAFWMTHKRRFNRWYGRSHLSGAWRPWRRLATRDGAEEITDGGIYRFAYKGPVMYYPPDQFQKKGGGGVDYDAARDKAREFVETAKAGASVALPDITNPDTKLNRWRIEWPDHVIDVSGLLEYSDSLKKEMSYGLEVPPEVIEANETGAGWSGRKVPLIGFFTGQVRNARAIASAWKWQIGDPCVAWNFGPGHWFEVEPQVVLPEELQGEEPGGKGEGSTSLPTGQDPKQGPQGAPGVSLPSTAPPKPTQPGGGVALATEAEGVKPAAAVEVKTEPPPPAPELVIEPADPSPGAPDASAAAEPFLRAFAKLRQSVRKELLAELAKGPLGTALERARQVIQKYHPNLTHLLTGSRLLGSLRGMAAVAARAVNVSAGAAKISAVPLGGSFDLSPQDIPTDPASAQSPPSLPEGVPFVAPLAPDAPAPPYVALPLIEDAAQSLANKRLLTKVAFDQLEGESKDSAFTVAGVETEATLGKIRDALIAAVEGGETQRQFVRRVDESVGVGTFLSPQHAETVFRGAVMAAYSDGQQRLLEHPAVDAQFPYRRYIATADDRVRPTHLAMEHHGIGGTAIYRADDVVWQMWRPPAGYNCFVPGTKVQGRFNVGLKSWYAGEVFEITTRGGRRLTVTANHPVLTVNGFVAANELCEGDDLVCYGSRGEDGKNLFGAEETSVARLASPDGFFPLPRQDEQHGPTVIEQVFRALMQMGPLARLPIGSRDLLGDARFGNGEIEIVGAYRELGFDVEADRLQRLPDVRFAGMDEALTFVAGGRSRREAFRANDAASCGGMDGGQSVLDGPRNLAQLRPLLFLRFGLAADIDAGIREGGLNCGTRDIESNTQRQHRFTGDVAGDDIGDGSFVEVGDTSDLYQQTVLLQQPRDRRTLGRELVFQLTNRHPGAVSLDQIVQVRALPYAGHVYDLQSEGGWLVADGIYCSNCRCTWVPVTIREAARQGVQEAKDWARTGNPPLQPAYVTMPPFKPDPAFDRGVTLDTSSEADIDVLRAQLVGKTVCLFSAAAAVLPLDGIAAQTLTAATSTLADYENCFVGDISLATSDPNDWTSYKGARGGQGWRNVRTGRVVYQPDKPGTRRKAAQEQPPAAPRPAAQPQQTNPRPKAATPKPPAPAVPKAPAPQAPPKPAADLSAISEQAAKEMADPAHPLNRLRDKMVKASFRGQVIRTLHDKGGTPLTAQDHVLTGRAHARVGAILNANGEADLAQAHFAAARYHNEASRKVAAPAAAPQKAPPAHAKLLGRFSEAAKSAKGLSPQQRHEYTRAADVALRRMPQRALDHLTQDNTQVLLYGSLQDLGNELVRGFGMDPGDVGGVGGCVDGMGGVHLDGAHEGMPAHEIYAHEFTHLLDERGVVEDKTPGSKGWKVVPNHSESPGWAAAFKGEIDHDHDPLSEYARADPQEAFAEFGRLIYATDKPLREVEKQFPLASKYFKSEGLWPAQ